MKMDKQQIGLCKNTFFLYLLTFSNQILGLLVIPYLTRILGPSIYGELGMALSLMIYVTIILDFGFMLSATEIVALNKEDINVCNLVFSSVTIVRCLMIILLSIIFAMICLIIPSWNGKFIFYMIFYFAYAINSLLPDYIYRGMEHMKSITIRTVMIKSFFTFLVFVFIRGKDDLIKYPIILAIGNIIAVLYSFVHIYKKYKIHFVIPNNGYVYSIVKKTLPFFVSRIASTFYQAATTIILGTVYAGAEVVGFFAATDKLMSLTKSVSSPVADSLYPYMVKSKNYTLVKKILILTTPIIIALGIVVFVFAEKICIVLFGQEYAEAKLVLRCLIPAMMVIFPTYIICFPVLVPMGLSKQANRSNVIGAVVQVLLLSILFLSSKYSAIAIVICGSVSEVTVFVYRVMTILKNKGALRLN